MQPNLTSVNGHMNSRHAAKPKLNALTSLRFIAASMIVIQHLKGVIWLSQDFLPHFVLTQAVSFFFVLSGFILTYNYHSLPDYNSIRRFWIARIARIWPAHAAAFFLFIGIFYPWSLQLIHDNGWIAAANLLMVHGWIPISEVFFSFNAVSWSISTEFGFYLLFPFLIADFERTWCLKLFFSAMIVVALVIVGNVLDIPSEVTTAKSVSRSGLVNINPLGRLFEFVLGMCASRVLERSVCLRQIGFVQASAYEVVFLLLVVLSMTAASYCDILIQWIGQTGGMYLIQSGTGIFFTGFVVIVAAQKGMLSRFLSNRVFVFLGEISYSVYLFHQIMLRFYSVYLINRFPMIPDAVLYLLFWFFLLAFSAFVWKCIERPVRYFLRRILSGPVIRNRSPVTDCQRSC